MRWETVEHILWAAGEQEPGPAGISELEVIAEDDGARQGSSKDWGQPRGPPRTPCPKASAELEWPQDMREELR